MRKVHWSVWGFVGFFGMVGVGLWIDSHWLLGVGSSTTTTVIPTPVPIRQIQEQVLTPPFEEVETACDPADDFGQFQPDAEGDVDSETIELSSPDVLGGYLEIPFELVPQPAELLPDPQTPEDAATVDEPLNTSAFTFMRLAIPIGPVWPVADSSSVEETSTDEPLYRAVPAVSEPMTDVDLRTSSSRVLAGDVQGPDDPTDPHSGMMEQWRESSAILRSREFAPDAESQAECGRDVDRALRQKQHEDREAALLDPPPPPRPPCDYAASPVPPKPMPGISPEQVEALRGAAQQLDEIANHLERHNLYPRADEVRGIAQDVRMDARKGPKPTPVVPIAP